MLRIFELLPGVPNGRNRATEYRVVLITKGDLFHRKPRSPPRAGDLFTASRSCRRSTRGVRAGAAECNEASRFAWWQFPALDIEPVVTLGGWGVHVPYHVTWAHELEHGLDDSGGRVIEVADAGQIPAAIARLERLATG